jgi:hypothetical protein
VIADDVLVHGMSLTGIVLKGKEAIKQFVIEMKSAFPGKSFQKERRPLRKVGNDDIHSLCFSIS